MKPFYQEPSYPPSLCSFSHFNLKGQKQQQDEEEESKKEKKLNTALPEVADYARIHDGRGRSLHRGGGRAVRRRENEK